VIDMKNAVHTYWALRIVLGVAAVLAGLDKFFNLLTNWEQYLNPIAPDLLHISAVGFMHVVGIIEMIVGVAILGGFTELFGYVMCIWLLGIIANLLSMGKFLDVALRDLGLSVSAFSLAQLSTSPSHVSSISGLFGRKTREHRV
jgi:uncharacterized membrane protein YphA (DoxX/SURF4 family)